MISIVDGCRDVTNHLCVHDVFFVKKETIDGMGI